MYFEGEVWSIKLEHLFSSLPSATGRSIIVLRRDRRGGASVCKKIVWEQNYVNTLVCSIYVLYARDNVSVPEELPGHCGRIR